MTIRTAHDVTDLWADVLKATSVMLWCDGLKTELTKPSTSQKRKHGVGSDNESGEEEFLGNAPKKKKTAEKGRLRYSETKTWKVVYSNAVSDMGRNGC